VSIFASYDFANMDAPVFGLAVVVDWLLAVFNVGSED
jgi:hypothetical protein